MIKTKSTLVERSCLIGVLVILLVVRLLIAKGSVLPEVFAGLIFLCVMREFLVVLRLLFHIVYFSVQFVNFIC